MYVRSSVRFRVVAIFAWRYVLFYLAWSGAIALAYSRWRWAALAVPFAPLSLIGVAVAFYVGFKNSQSYDRFWEARKSWGSIVNSSRTLGLQILTFTGASAAVRRAILHRHLAWINLLRLQLRRQESWHEVTGWLSEEEQGALPGWRNKAAQLQLRQGQALAQLREQGLLSDVHHVAVAHVLAELCDAQGRCERIKNTPFPRQYAYFSRLFVWLFVLLLPFGLLHTLGPISPWLMIPTYTLIAWIFMTMELVGHFSENPFENFINDVPMSALCRSIEIDLRQMLGDEDLPQPLQPVQDALY